MVCNIAKNRQKKEDSFVNCSRCSLLLLLKLHSEKLLNMFNEIGEKRKMERDKEKVKNELAQQVDKHAKYCNNA